MDEETKVPTRTDEEKKEAANACMAEILEVLKKHNCRVKQSFMMDSENVAQFNFTVTTND